MATLTTFSANTVIKSADVNANFAALNYDIVWKTYTPVWTATTTAPALGNGTLTGRYMQIGKMVFFELDWVAGTTTTYGTGNFRFSLPISSRSLTTTEDEMPIGRAHCIRQGVAHFFVDVALRIPDSTIELWYVTAVGASSASANVTNTTPYTWASTDFINLIGAYEAA